MTDTERKKLLLRFVMQLVEKQLATQGLRTFAAILGEGREIQLLIPEEIREDPTLDEVDKYWAEQLRSKVKAGQNDAACYCVDVKVLAGDGKPVTPGVVVYVEEAETGAEYRFYSYEKRQDRSAIMREPTIEPTPVRLFTSS